MPRLTADQWAQVRADREGTGASFKALADKYGVSDVAIVKRSQAEAWSDGQDVAKVVRRKVSEKVNGIVSGTNPQRRAAAIESRAEKVTAVIRLHQDEWEQHRAAFGAAPESSEAARIGKTSAEMLKIRQAGERVAWGLGAEAIDPTQAAPAAVELVFRGT